MKALKQTTHPADTYTYPGPETDRLAGQITTHLHTALLCPARLLGFAARTSASAPRASSHTAAGHAEAPAVDLSAASIGVDRGQGKQGRRKHS